MSKALTQAQTDLDTLKAELEAWIASQPPKPAQPVRKPAIKRTRAQLIAVATAPAVVVPQTVDTSWLELVSAPPVSPPVEAPQAAVVTPQAAVVEHTAPLYVDATHLVRIALTPEPIRIPIRTTTPKKKPRTLRQAIRAGNYSK